MRCSSSLVPSVAVTSACVSPRVKSAEPCVRGSSPTSMSMLADLDRTRGHPDGGAPSASRRGRCVPSDGRRAACLGLLSLRRQLSIGFFLQFVDLVIALDLRVLLGVHRVGEIGAESAFRSCAYNS